MHKYLPIEIVFIPNRVFQNFTRSADPIYFFFSFPLFSFYSVLFYFIFTPGYPFVRGNLEKILITLSSPTLPQPSLPPRLSFERNENRNRISTRKSKNNRIGKGSTWPGTICFTAINDWQFAKIPRRFRPLGFTSLRDRTNARPSNGFAVRITLCVEAAAEKCNGGRQGRERELRMGGGDCALREFHRVNMKH